MKNVKKILTISVLILFLFVFFATKFWISYFLDLNSNGSLSLNVKDYGYVDLKSIKIMDDAIFNLSSQTNEIPSYQFNVINYKTSTSYYKLYFRDVPYYKINDGCTNFTTIKRSEINYALYLNGSLIKTDTLSNLENDLLDSRSINIDVTNKYELKLWLNQTAAEDIDNNHFHYRVEIVEGK